MYGDPDALDRLAARLSARADEVRERADDHVRAGHAAHWVSDAAQRYRDQVARDRLRMHRAADELDAAASALRAHAQQVREVLAEIARIEHAATAWFEHQASRLADEASSVFDAARRGISGIIHDPPWHHWPFTPSSLPRSGDKAWLDVGQFLRGQGVLS